MKFCKEQNEITTRYILPVHIISYANAEQTEILLNEHPRQAFLGEIPTCTIGKNGYILLDFGTEFQGGADIVVQSVEGESANLRLVFGESVSEALSRIGEKNATNDHSARDMTITTGHLSHICLGNTGYRFLKIETQNSGVQLSSVQGVSRFRDLVYRGSFTCSDERLNEIWRVGAKTVHLNMQEYLWDGIKRDRLVWVGDMHPETQTISSVFGENPVVAKSLDFIRDNTPGDGWMNGTQSYSMWWVKIQLDLYRDHANASYLKEQLPFLLQTLKNTLSRLDEDGQCDIDFQFIEWSSKETPDEEAGFYAMLIIGLEAGADILDVLESNATLSIQCRNAAKKIKSREYTAIVNKQVAAVAALSGLCDLKSVCSNLLKPGGTKGLSAFWGYYVLLALAKNNETTFALEIIRKYWGAMIDLGATTFWEDFDTDWIENACRIDEVPSPDKNDIHGDFGKYCYQQLRLSLCHGWASGPTAFLSRQILGVQALEAGYKKIKVVPDLGDLSFAEGYIPTPHGEIFVRHTKKDNKIITDITLPAGVALAD